MWVEESFLRVGNQHGAPAMRGGSLMGYSSCAVRVEEFLLQGMGNGCSWQTGKGMGRWAVV